MQLTNDDPESALRAYVRAFERLDPDAALPFYHVPSMFVAPQGAFSAPDAGTLKELLSQFMAQLRAQSYRRTDVGRVEVRALSAELALCTGVMVRFDTSDREIARLGFSYLMRRVTGTWSIVVAAVHEPPAA